MCRNTKNGAGDVPSRKTHDFGLNAALCRPHTYIAFDSDASASMFLDRMSFLRYLYAFGSKVLVKYSEREGAAFHRQLRLPLRVAIRGGLRVCSLRVRDANEEQKEPQRERVGRRKREASRKVGRGEQRESQRREER